MIIGLSDTGSVFIRKNMLVLTVVFTADDGSLTQPSAANVSLNYPDQNGARHTLNALMDYNSVTSVWEYEWDSSAAGNGTVEWSAWGYGQLQAATQGSFEITANRANVY
jgi:hypothetical protein